MMFASQTPILSLPVPIANVWPAGRPSVAVAVELEPEPEPEPELDLDLDAGVSAALPTTGEATTDTSAPTTKARMRDQFAR
jgi:hypothetical protein